MYGDGDSDRVTDFQGASSITDEVLLCYEKDRVALLKAGDMECRIVDDHRVMRWNKLLWNGSFGPVSILAGGTRSAVECGRFLTWHRPQAWTRP